MKFDYIIWDWNGTVIDDMQVALDAVNVMLHKQGRTPIDKEAYQDAMDTPIIHFYEQFFNMQETSMEWISGIFQDYYANHRDEIALQPGVLDKLKEFKKSGCRQIVLSSSATSVIERDAKKYGVRDYFSAMLGADNMLSESKVGRALEYFADNNWDGSRALLLGDTLHDGQVAGKLGCKCILFACGHQSRSVLEKSGNTVYDTFDCWKL